jgi:hypothetical protein
MAVADVILVNVRSTENSTITYTEPTLIPTYIVRDYVQYYGKYQNIKGEVSESLTAVTFAIPNVNIPGTRLFNELVVELPLTDFNTLMTT